MARDGCATRLLAEEIYHSDSPAHAIRNAVLGIANDDVAVLTMSVGSQTAGIVRWSFRCDNASEVRAVRQDFARLLLSANATEAEAADAELVFGELLGNIVRHSGGGEVEAALDLTTDEPVLHVLDRGPAFTFRAQLPADKMSESGRGLYITKMLAREIGIVQRPDGGNHARAILSVRKKSIARFPIRLSSC